MSDCLGTEYSQWYEKITSAKIADVIVAIDRDLRQVKIHSACDGWKQNLLQKILSDFDSRSLVGLSFERVEPDVVIIEVNACWDLKKIHDLVLERIRLESGYINVKVADTSLYPD